MRSTLKNGKIPEPKSLAAAIERQRQCTCEIGRVEAHLADVLRATKFQSMTEYDTWKVRAKRALWLFREEARQLAEWIATKRDRDVMQLLRESYALLKTFEGEDALEEDEKPLVRRLDEFFGEEEKEEVKSRVRSQGQRYGT